MASIPNDETGNALRQFVKDGSDLSEFMEIDFFVAIPSKQKGNEVALEARELGFKTSVELDVESGEWTCYCTKTLIPEYLEVVKIEKQLSTIAKLRGGYADGFGSYGNADTNT
ncbi:MAG: ribonuclease E inhibitor RraB [Sedimenticola sp.]